MPERYSKEIRSYDIHTYYFETYEPSRNEALELRSKLEQDFASELKDGSLVMYRMIDRPIGPHPYAMFEVDFRSPEVFAKIVPWFQLNHGSLSVLIHPHTGNDYLDHGQHAIWLGKQVPLNFHMLENIEKFRSSTS